MVNDRAGWWQQILSGFGVDFILEYSGNECD